MTFHKKVILLILLKIIIYCPNIYSESNPRIFIDNSQKLIQFFQQEKNELNITGTISVSKESDAYVITVHDQNKTFSKILPKEIVDNYFNKESDENKKVLMKHIWPGSKE